MAFWGTVGSLLGSAAKTVASNTDVIGLGLSAYGAYSTNQQYNEDVRASNAFQAKQYERNKNLTIDMLTTLDERTNRAEAEATRYSIRNKIQVRKAAHVAEGEATVRAAAIGGGRGVRASLATFRPAARVAGDLITEANINLQTELINIKEQHDDAAVRAIINLENNTPLYGGTQSTMSMLTDMAGSTLSYYNNMSDARKSNLKGIFSRTRYESIKPIQINYGGR